MMGDNIKVEAYLNRVNPWRFGQAENGKFCVKISKSWADIIDQII